MQKKLLLAAMVSAMAVAGTHSAWAADTEVSNFTDLNSAVQNPATTGIDINSNITATGNINAQGQTILTINGNNYYLDGNGQYLGFNTSLNQTLNINQTTLTNYDSSNFGEVIYNAGTVTINNSSLDENFANSGGGGAIYNAGTVTINNSSLDENSANSSGGGAIYNTGTVTINNSSLDENSANSSGGGAIYNTGTVTINNSSLDENSANSGGGGAIYNTGTVTINNSSLDENSANSGGGGAIYNTGTVTINNSSLVENFANAGSGGAIYNVGIATIYNSSLVENFANSYGGAIYNAGTLNLIADSGNVEFTENTANGVPNALYSYGGTTNLNAGSGKIIFNDPISSGSTNNILNINQTGTGSTGNNIPVTAPTNGAILLNADMSGFGGGNTDTVNFYNGTVQLGSNATFFKDVTFNMYSGTNLNMQNGKIDNISLSQLNLIGAGNHNVQIDVDGATSQADNFVGTKAGTIATGAVLNINSINILSNTKSTSTNIQLTDDSALKGAIHLDNSVKTLNGPICQYNISYNATSGDLNIIGGGNSYSGYHPNVFSAGTAAHTGGYLGALATYNEIFSRVDQPLLDLNMLQSQLGYDPKLLNKTASAAGQAEFSPLMDATKQPAIWFKPFSTFENVPLNNGPTVSNISYGGLIGVDSGLRNLGKGYDYVITVYGGYTGSHQVFNGVSLYQNGGFGGLMGTVYKGDFFSALTANAGGSDVSSNNSPDFGMFNTGVASKTGYNFRMFKNKLIFQPSYLMSYTFVNTQGFTNTQGVNISTAPLNAMQLVPGAKLIFNLKHGWQPYLSVNMVWNLLDEVKVTANEVSLPEVSVDPYVEYGAGVQKKFGNRFTGFFQSMVRNGGRNGVSLLAGFKWTI